MVDTGKARFDLKTEISLFSESKYKEAPGWLNIPDKNRDKVNKGIQISRSMLLDSRKWKMKDLVEGCYAVARYELKLFDSQFTQIETKLIKSVNKEKRTKYKKIAEIVRLPDVDKDPKLKQIFKSSAAEAIKAHASISKKIEDKVSLALDEVEANKGDNKKSMSAAKDGLRKFLTVDFKSTFEGPSKQSVLAMMDLAKKLNDPANNPPPKDAIQGALKLMKDAESDFEKKHKKAAEANKAILDLGDKLQNDKGADPSLNKLGEKLSDKSAVGKSLRAVTKNLEKQAQLLDKVKNDVSSAMSFAGDEAKLKAFASRLLRDAKELELHGVASGRSAGEAVKHVNGFKQEYKTATKDLK